MDEFPYQGLWLYTGAQGSGKTLLMMHHVRQILKEYPKAILVSNISIFGVPAIPFTSVSQFDTLNNGVNGIIFVFDEVHTLWATMESRQMSPTFLTYWSQNRKNRRVIVGTSQRFNRIAKPLREQCMYHFSCGNHVGPFYCFRTLDGALYDDDGKYQGDKLPRLEWYVPRVGVMRMYNTLEIIKRDGVDRGLSDNSSSGSSDSYINCIRDSR